MSPITNQITEMVDMLPEQEQNLAFELIKRLVLAWDPDFTKVTPAERALMEIAEQELLSGDTITLDDFRAGLS